MTRRWGWFGGTFDPPHLGHLRLALDAVEAHADSGSPLEQVLFVPTGRNPFKDEGPVVADADRVAMLAAALAGEPRFVVSDLELQRAAPQRTIDSLRAAAERWPDVRFTLILGADAWNGFGRWAEPQAVLALADVAVGGRPGSPLLAPGELPGLDPDGVLCYDTVRADAVWKIQPVAAGSDAWVSTVTRFPSRALDISATWLREALRRGRSVRYLMPDAVIGLIKENKLYGSC